MTCEDCGIESVVIDIGGKKRCPKCAEKFTDRGYGLTSELQSEIVDLKEKIERMKEAMKPHLPAECLHNCGIRHAINGEAYCEGCGAHVKIVIKGESTKGR